MRNPAEYFPRLGQRTVNIQKNQFLSHNILRQHDALSIRVSSQRLEYASVRILPVSRPICIISRPERTAPLPSIRYQASGSRWRSRSRLDTVLGLACIWTKLTSTVFWS